MRALSVMYPLILNSWLINICTTNTISDRARLQRHRGKVVHESAGSGEGGQGRGLKPQEYLVVITPGVGGWTTLQEGKGMKIEMLVEYAFPLAIP